jgi:hypothetical protein
MPTKRWRKKKGELPMFDQVAGRDRGQAHPDSTDICTAEDLAAAMERFHEANQDVGAYDRASRSRGRRHPV